MALRREVMPFLDNINFFATVLTAGCISFVASNFGIKLGRLASFKNNTGFKYISDSTKSEKLYEQIAKVAANESGAPDWAKDKLKLKNWCKGHEKSLRHWAQTSKYCLIKNNVRHQLINKGHEIKELPDSNNNGCTEDILNSYDDGTENSWGYFLKRLLSIENLLLLVL